MPTWLKVSLVVAALGVVMLVVLVGAGVYLVREHGPGMIRSGEQAYGEGQEFGRATDQQGCFDEGLARHRRADGLGELLKTNLFLRSCLDAARETPGFCDAPPPPSEFVKSIRWQMSECERHGLSSDQQCGQLFQQVQQSCEQRRARASGHDSR